MRSIRHTIKLSSRRGNTDSYRAAAEAPYLNIKTAVEDPTFAELNVAGVDIGLKNILTVTYLKEGELRQQSFGTLPAWIFNHTSESTLSKLCKDGRAKDWKEKHPLAPVVKNTAQFSGTLRAAALMRNIYILELSQFAASQLINVLKEAGTEYIALEHNMYAMTVSDNTAARFIYEQEIKCAEILTTDMLYKAVSTAVADEAEKCGMKVISVDARNTSRLCCKCGGWINATDLKSSRYFVKCESCGSIWPRDLNASANIMTRGMQTIAELQGRTDDREIEVSETEQELVLEMVC